MERNAIASKILANLCSDSLQKRSLRIMGREKRIPRKIKIVKEPSIGRIIDQDIMF
ncbi:hypothetical protein [Pedobacter cryoconitis]|uniref:hypothetical protein n=1 Tax=Pedobacter cryoconitis TaxID=188932 RepID=UPI00147382FC|nr:hypothetical protein [Pedobacter cryoconitis]